MLCSADVTTHGFGLEAHAGCAVLWTASMSRAENGGVHEEGMGQRVSPAFVTC